LISDDMIFPVSRRSFLKAGLAGTLVLATAGGIYRAAIKPSRPGRFALDDQGKAALGAIIGAVLHGALPPRNRAIEMAVSRTLRAIDGLPLATQKEVQDLFGLLTFAPTRRLVAGVSVQWSDASTQDVTAFLQNWRTHRFATLQSAYHALHDLIIGAWYADESSWASIGYPGPLKALG
jgi:hypothetical protein